MADLEFEYRYSRAKSEAGSDAFFNRAAKPEAVLCMTCGIKPATTLKTGDSGWCADCKPLF